MTDREFMLHAFKGDAAAVEYVLMLARVADVWDNLIDKDVAVGDADINDAFWILSVEIPGNAFYRRHMDDLLPVTKAGITNWMIATSMERAPAGNLALEISHVIRYSIADLVVMAALLSGGREWAAEVGPELRLRSQRSDMAEYLKSLANKQQNHGELR